MLVASAACASDSEASTVGPASVEILDRTRNGLAAGALVAANGTYTGCVSRSGAWSVRISGAGALDNDPLSVVKNDTGCVLTLTELVADQTFASSGIALAASYPGTAKSFAVGGVTAFTANAKLDSVSFANDFVLSVSYSDDLRSASDQQLTGTYATVSVSTQTLLVPAPDYTMSLVTGSFTVQMDAGKIVTGVSGTATLTAGTQTGEAYAVDLGALSAVPTYATVAAAYLVAGEQTLSGTTVPASAFGLVGANLTSNVTRTLIVSHTSAGVKGYQLFKITFEGS